MPEGTLPPRGKIMQRFENLGKPTDGGEKATADEGMPRKCWFSMRIFIRIADYRLKF